MGLSDIKLLNFYKPQDQWYLDLPEEIATQVECLMVGGTPLIFELLTTLQENKDLVKLEVSEEPIEEFDLKISLTGNGVVEEDLKEWGHEIVDSGGFYYIQSISEDTQLPKELLNYKIWICPTTVKVFGHYPEELFIKHII
jgi:hypothetical protein